MVIAKQGIDLHTSTYAQAIGAEYLLGGYVPAQVGKIIKLYAPKLETILSALEENFPQECKWSKPDGGMFLWVEGPKGVDMEEVYKRAIEKGVGFVPGKFFYPKVGDGIETMRLNFTNSTHEQLKKAIKILAEAIIEEKEQVVL